MKQPNPKPKPAPGIDKTQQLNNTQRLAKPGELNNANKPRHQAPAKIQMNSIL